MFLLPILALYWAAVCDRSVKQVEHKIGVMM